MRIRGRYIVIGIAAIVLIGFLTFTTVDWPTGAGTGEMQVVITEVDTGTEWTATAPLQPPSMAASALSTGFSIPFQVEDVTVPPLDPTNVYTVSFYVTTSIVNADELSLIDVERVAITSLTNEEGEAMYRFHDGYGWVTQVIDVRTNLDPAESQVFETPSFTHHKTEAEGPTDREIRGMDINNTHFTLQVYTEATDIDGYPAESANVEMTFRILMDDPTSINLVVEDITAD